MVNTQEKISDLIKELRDENPLNRRNARISLVQIGDESLPALLKALDSPSEYTRLEAVRAMRSFWQPLTSEALVRKLMDEKVSVRHAAMEALISKGRNSLHPILVEFTTHFYSARLKEGAYHILHVLKDRHLLRAPEIRLFNALKKQVIPAFNFNPNIEAAWLAEKALEALEHESDRK